MLIIKWMLCHFIIILLKKTLFPLLHRKLAKKMDYNLFVFLASVPVKFLIKVCTLSFITS